MLREYFSCLCDFLPQRVRKGMHKGFIPRCISEKRSGQVLLVSGLENAFMNNRNCEAVRDSYAGKHSLKLCLDDLEFLDGFTNCFIE
jgi:hypothetical protein